MTNAPSDLPRRFVELARGPAAYTDEGDGPPIVLVHGLPGSGRDFRWLAPVLGERARVLRVDMPGFGETPTSTTPGLAPVDRARFVLAFIEALGLERPLVAGHSMGGVVITAAASIAPTRLSGLVYISSPGFTRHAGFARPLWLFARAIDAPLLGRVLRPVVSKGFVAQGFKGHPEDALFRTLRAIQHTDITAHAARLRRLRVPALVSYAEDDRLIAAHIGDALARGLGARRVIFPDGGHNPQKTHAKELARAMSDFAVQTRAGVAKPPRRRPLAESSTPGSSTPGSSTPEPSVRVVVGAFALAGQNLGLDALASAERFADNLRPALQAELPGLPIEVQVDDDAEAARVRVEITGAVSKERRAQLVLVLEGTANAVRAATEWAVWG